MTQARDLADGKFDTDTLVVDAANNRVGVGLASPSKTLHVESDSSSVAAQFKYDGSTSYIALENDTKSDGYIGYTNAGKMEFWANGSQRASLLSSGGLTFNGDTAAANALDDYEEGTWTPANASIASITFSSATGKYVKIGSFVLATGFVTYPSTSDSNHAKIGGLPFPITSNGHSSATISYKSTSNLATMNPAQSTSEMNLHTESGGTTTNANMSNATVYFAAMYRNA